MKPTAAVVTMLLAFSFFACGDTRTATETRTETPQAAVQSANLTPEQLGELGAQIQRNPDRADALLAQHNLTRESFEKAIRNVTESADASKRYAAAFKKASA